MAAAEVGFVTVSRAVIAAAADLVSGVERRMVGDENVRTARGNAWAAICADRARAQARADMDAMVAALASRPGGARRDRARRDRATQGGRAKDGRARHGDQRAVGSSPRSSASQTALVSTR